MLRHIVTGKSRTRFDCFIIWIKDGKEHVFANLSLSGQAGRIVDSDVNIGIAHTKASCNLALYNTLQLVTYFRGSIKLYFNVDCNRSYIAN